MNFWDIFHQRIPKDIELTLAKCSATISKLFRKGSFEKAEEVFSHYCLFKKQADDVVMAFDETAMRQLPLEPLRATLENYSLFYSFCFGYYKLLPLLIALQGYSITVLIEERVYKNQIAVFQQLNVFFENRFNKKLDINFLTHTEVNIVYKLKDRLNDKHNKVIVYVDGNKGSLDKLDNLQTYIFKGCEIKFHEGYAMLCWLLKYEQICGLICKDAEGKLVVEIVESDLAKASYRKEFSTNATSKILYVLESLLTLANVHQWDALVSVYQWFVVDESDTTFENSTPHKYIPFVLEHEYYALSRENFIVHSINRKIYRLLRKYNGY